MKKNRDRYCVFCGNVPEIKNREHVLPQWLIEFTGNPKRIVPFGKSLTSGKEIRFDWSSFAFPACTKCNDNYSSLEFEIKPIILKLIEREDVILSEIVKLLDWLDKVRIGLWLGYSYLQNNFFGIRHKFFIHNRIGIKDRMLAVYPIESDEKGLNTFGVETLLFLLKPSCISLRINNLHILNMSWDFMCSARCGFPFPKEFSYDSANNISFTSEEVEIYNKVKHPIMKIKYLKPSIHIYQPILSNSIHLVHSKNEIVKKRILPNSESYGVLYRQFDDHVELLENLNQEISFDEISLKQASFTKDIIKQTYEFQLKSILQQNVPSSVTQKIFEGKSLLSILKKDLNNYINHLKHV
ncbi:MAG: hypothetical protein GY936_18110 [Ignavibacteriae bacterium]|nr:hypothetical protein [Ignavibacteriota bacterium]